VSSQTNALLIDEDEIALQEVRKQRVGSGELLEAIGDQNGGVKIYSVWYRIGLLGAVGANAADLPPPPASSIYIPPPAFTWAGPYLGVTAGYANGFHTFDDLAGAFLGYPGL
jgi:hypothetical protein